MSISAFGYQAATLLEQAQRQSTPQVLTTVWISPAARVAQIELEAIVTDLYHLENNLRQFFQSLELVRWE